ncbi:MAG: phospho-sugar mutase [Propionibacteriaceae bacterium]|jgi:phosphomannomutase|nr:phospho-sugar mutase [Propionibacteriaceae bacterium]
MDIFTQANDWLTHDPDPDTRRELQHVLNAAKSGAKAKEDLEDRFSGMLQFGTAGLRGKLGAGPNRMNRAVVIKAARGLVDYLKLSLDKPKVVIGNDARHKSREFALDTAGVVTAMGGEALLLPDKLPTPLLAYAVRALHADAGVMVTASHNPPQDNGYKVYLGGRMVSEPERGAQIVPPYDSEIAACIAKTAPADEIERAGRGWTDIGPELEQQYIEAVAAGETRAEAQARPPIKIVHTAMHGVGSHTALEALVRAGFENIESVKEQKRPDPDFPTVAFPNPEEPGAIDLALKLARDVDADVVIANDPDADRCAVATWDPRSGGWRMLHGDELGAILGHAVAEQLSLPVPDIEPEPDAPVLANSIVSSRLLGKIAAAHSLPYQQTLTGFKWMGRVPNLAYAYEEAIGYCVRPDLVHDKDGISAAVLVARVVSDLKADGLTLTDLLDNLARAHGLYLTDQLSARFTDLELIPETMKRLRENPPKTLAGSPIVESHDLSKGYNGLPATDGILMLTAANDRVVVRPSGTEPKVKCYLEVVSDVDPDASFDDLTSLRAHAKARLGAIKEDLNTALFA